MVENVGRKLVLIAALVGTALLLLLLPTFPLQLGLDLAGGMRLVYKLDFELAEQQGLIPEGPGGREEVMQETIAERRRSRPFRGRSGEEGARLAHRRPRSRGGRSGPR